VRIPVLGQLLPTATGGYEHEADDPDRAYALKRPALHSLEHDPLRVASIAEPLPITAWSLLGVFVSSVTRWRSRVISGLPPDPGPSRSGGHLMRAPIGLHQGFETVIEWQRRYSQARGKPFL
jgi:hypothetical protein